MKRCPNCNVFLTGADSQQGRCGACGRKLGGALRASSPGNGSLRAEFLASAKQHESEAAEDPDSLQDEVDSLLTRGIVFSIMWLLGFGSAYSVLLACQARTIITQSEGEARGLGRVVWCFVVGGCGVCVLALQAVAMFVNSR